MTASDKLARAEAQDLMRENERLRKALAPFLDIRSQNGAWGAISKKLDGFAPLAVTVTKAQMMLAWEAYHGAALRAKAGQP